MEVPKENGSSGGDVVGPAPRLCHLVKWPDFDGYGFNLHAEKAKSGQFIGKVDDDSPAQLAGLREGDRIIEVNGVNIANENHRQVVERIKAMVNETKLLVLDDEGDKFYKERKLVVKSSQSNVVYNKTPPTQPNKQQQRNNNNNNNRKESIPEQPRVVEQQEQPPQQVAPSIKPEEQTNGIRNRTPTPPPKEPVEEPKEKSSPVVVAKKAASPAASPKPAKSQDVKNGSATPSSGDLNLNMSAAQMREMLSNRKKRDPRNQSLDMREKYQIVQQM